MSYLSFVFSLFSFQGAFQAIKAWFKHLSFKCLNHSLIKVRSKSDEVKSDVSASPTYLKCSPCEHLTYYLLPITYYLLPRIFSPKKFWWAKVDSNHRPHDYQSCALTSWAIGPNLWASVLNSLTVEPFTLSLTRLSTNSVSRLSTGGD